VITELHASALDVECNHPPYALEYVNSRAFGTLYVDLVRVGRPGDDVVRCARCDSTLAISPDHYDRTAVEQRKT